MTMYFVEQQNLQYTFFESFGALPVPQWAPLKCAADAARRSCRPAISKVP